MHKLYTYIYSILFERDNEINMCIMESFVYISSYKNLFFKYTFEVFNMFIQIFEKG